MATKAQSISERAMPKQQTETRDRTPDYVVRVKTGPGGDDWGNIGFAWKRTNGEGFSVKLNSLPISNEWKGVLKLLPYTPRERNSSGEGNYPVPDDLG